MKIQWQLLFFLFVFKLQAQLSDFNHINFQKADSIALSYKHESLNNLPLLSYKLTANLNTDAERFRAIYRWVCNNIANDYPLYLKNKRKREKFKNDNQELNTWNDQIKSKIFKTLLKRKKTICTGYAYLVKTLSNLANINCEIVHGYGKTSLTPSHSLNMPNHSWNAVLLNNKWYLCDPTWASGIPNPETNIFMFQYNDGYFLTSPEMFALNHFPINTKWLLTKDNTPTFNLFLETPIVYASAYNTLLSHIAPKKMYNEVSKNELIHFKYQLLNISNTKDINLVIDNGHKNYTESPKTITLKNNMLTFNYFFKKKGFYDVHFYIKNELISTYTFKVKA